jgi:hypothetical protein
MKVKELIEILKNKDPEDLALISGHEAGFDTIDDVQNIEVCGPFIREGYYGEYDYCKKDELLKIKAILLK